MMQIAIAISISSVKVLNQDFQGTIEINHFVQISWLLADEIRGNLLEKVRKKCVRLVSVQVARPKP
jgi:hypothetical protein